MISHLGVVDIYTLLEGLFWTVVLSSVSFVGGAIIGVVLLVLRLSAWSPLRSFAWCLVQIVQGIPLLGHLFLVFFGLPLLGIDVPPLLAAGISLSVFAGAYFCDIWLGAVNSLPQGQSEAARALGLKRFKQFQLVIFPQALAIAIPPTIGFVVQLIKNTSIASIAGVVELSRTGQIISSATYEVFIVYTAVCALYFAICYPVTIFSRFLERRINVRHRTA
jgi:polar amino acid transport system permease protein